MEKSIQRVLTRLKADLSNIYGHRLRGVYLFGSYARNEADDESDLDVLIVLDRVEEYSAEIERTGDAVSRLSLESGITISRVFAAENRWLEDQTLFFLNVRDEAIPV